MTTFERYVVGLEKLEFSESQVNDNFLFGYVHMFITYFGGSSIATTIVLEESLDPVFLLRTMYFCSCNYIYEIIVYHGYMYSYNFCFGSNINILLRLPWHSHK